MSTIGLIVAAYVVLRCVEIFLSTTSGGTREKLKSPAPFIIRLLSIAVGVLAIVSLLGADI